MPCRWAAAGLFEVKEGVGNMAEVDYLRPITNGLGKLVPTGRALLNFINSKARGKGMELALNKVQFLNKSEKSTYTCMNVQLMEFRKHLQDIKVTDAESEKLVARAAEILDQARMDVERVYDEVRRYIITSEIRSNCVKHNFRHIPSLNDKQNELLAKEIFTLAYEDNMQSREHEVEDIVNGFRRINHIAVQLFAALESGKSK